MLRARNVTQGWYDWSKYRWNLYEIFITASFFSHLNDGKQRVIWFEGRDVISLYPSCLIKERMTENERRVADETGEEKGELPFVFFVFPCQSMPSFFHTTSEPGLD